MQAKSRFAEALEYLERGHEIGSRKANWSNPSAEWIKTCRRQAERDAKLLALLEGRPPTLAAVERLEMAELAHRKALYATAARLSSEAFAEQPGLAEDLDNAYRYDAACAAALAGLGQAQDNPPPDDAARARFREQALTWLRADLAASGKWLDGGKPEARAALVQRFKLWKEDPDLAAIRDEAERVKLPPPEQEALRALWADVDRLLARTTAPRP